jgi:hypothetical protein
MQPIKIGDRLVGPVQPTFIVAEIGINHNGDLDLAKKLMSTAAAAGCHRGTGSSVVSVVWRTVRWSSSMTASLNKKR